MGARTARKVAMKDECISSCYWMGEAIDREIRQGQFVVNERSFDQRKAICEMSSERAWMRKKCAWRDGFLYAGTHVLRYSLQVPARTRRRRRRRAFLQQITVPQVAFSASNTRELVGSMVSLSGTCQSQTKQCQGNMTRAGG